MATKIKAFTDTTKATNKPCVFRQATNDITEAMIRLKTELEEHQQKMNALKLESKFPNPYVSKPDDSEKKDKEKTDNKNPNLQPFCTKDDDKGDRNKKKIITLESTAISHGQKQPPAEAIRLFRERVELAKKCRKTFAIHGHWPDVRAALLSRGWIEKLHTTFRDQLAVKYRPLLDKSCEELIPLLHIDEYSTLARAIIKSNLLRDHQVDFYWCDDCLIAPFREFSDNIKVTLVNKFNRINYNFSTKIGMCETAKSVKSFQKGMPKLCHPRGYVLQNNLDAFWQDFNITSAMCMLKCIVERYKTKLCKIVSPNGTLPYEFFEFAVSECKKFIDRKTGTSSNSPAATEEKWSEFGDHFFKMVFYVNHFKQVNDDQTDEDVVSQATTVLKALSHIYPYLDMDGTHNIWILKPFARAYGQGIHICRTKRYIMSILKDNQFIAEKYIERPLLIYDTKFDIRQWFLITNAKPLTIWMWNDCYLRFSCQTYSLRKLHESIHLTNNAVQVKYFKNCVQESALPNYHMWDSKQLQTYLITIGYPNAYKDIIVPGMKDSIIASTIVNRNSLTLRPNCFELFGADFMLTPDFNPWLIEINSSPTLAHSTPVTARLCPKLLEDIMKVVIDYRNNTKASTGLFEIIYQEDAYLRGTGKIQSLKDTPDILKKLYNDVQEILRNLPRYNRIQ